MGKTKAVKLWAGVLVVTMLLSVMVSTVTAIGIEAEAKKWPNSGPRHYPFWTRENWDEETSMKVAVDSQNNVITVGMMENGEGAVQGVITKLSSDTGTVVWNTNPTSLNAQPLPLLGGGGMPPLWHTFHSYDPMFCPAASYYSVMMWDVAVGPGDDVFCIAEVYDVSNPNSIVSDVYVFKLDGDTGDQIWFRKIDVSMFDSYLSITVDAEGYAYITGMSAGLTPVPHADAWVAKLAKRDVFQGLPIAWHHKSYQNPNPWYTHIACDGQNYLYVAGGLASIQWSPDHGEVVGLSAIVDKYDCTDLSYEGRYQRDPSVDSMALSVTVENDIVAAVGMYDLSEVQGPVKQFIIKLYPNLQYGWHKTLDNGCLYDVAVWHYKNIDFVVATGYKDSVNKFFTTIRYASNGALYYSFTQVGDAPNSVAFSYGVTVDSEEYIIVTGEEQAVINGELHYCGLTIKNLVIEEMPMPEPMMVYHAEI